MSTEEWKNVVPRKCFATNKILHAKDKASIQVSISDVSQIIIYL